MKKYLSFIFVVAVLIAPSLTLADQNDDMIISRLQAQVAAIQVQIQALLAQRQGGSSGGSGSSVPSQTPPIFPAKEGENIPSFNRDLSFGKRGEDVRDLQEFLTDQGYYAGPITNYYGLLTVQGVKKFQQANGITPANGYFGSKTRALANKIFRELLSQICGEEGCKGNVLPAEKLFMQADSMSVGTIGDYLQIIYQAYGGSGNYSIQMIDGNVPGLEKYVPCELASDCPPKDKIGLAGTPTKSGAFSVTFLVKDLANESAYGRETFTIIIKDKVSIGRQPVISSIKGPTTLRVGEEGIWSIEARDPSRGALVYRVIWGDEVPQREAAASPTPQRAIPFRQTATFAHTYYNAGVYSPTFYVVNDRGSEVRTSITVNVGETPQPPSSIRVFSPNEGEFWKEGESRTISWSGVKGATTYKLTLLSSRNSFPARHHIDTIPSKLGSSETYIWTIPLGLGSADGKNPVAYYVRVAAFDGNGTEIVYGQSNEFTIGIRSVGTPSITVTSPNGGEVWQLRNTHTILWTPYNPTTGVNPALSEVNAYLEKFENGSFTAVGKIIPSGKASIHWDGDLDRYGNLPAPGEYYIRVTNTRTGATDRSDRPFTLVAWDTIKTDIKVNGSDGPVTLSPGSTYAVSWSSTNADSCEIYYPQDTTGVQTKYSATSSAGDKNFTFPGAFNYGVYVTAACKSSRIEGSANDSVLLNSSQPLSSITVNSPQGGESINFSGPYTINWRHTSDITKVSIALYKNDAFFNWITTNLPVVTKEGGSFAWTPSATISSANIGNNVFKIYVIGYKSAGGTVEDKSDSPFSIAAAGTTGYKLSANYISGNRSSYAAGEKISLTIRGIELFDGSPGESSEGFNVQVYIRGINDSYSLQGVNAVYNSRTGYWEAKLTAPADTSKTYKVESSFYCSNGSLACGQRYVSGKGEDGGQVNASFNFSVYGSGRTPVMVVSPNGGESYQAGQSAQMPIRWTADCGYVSFSILLAKGTYSGSNNQVINDSIPAGICSSGQSAIPYYTTWSIPSNLAAGSDYKILITGQLADSVVGQFGTGVGDDSDKPFSIVAATTTAAPSITSISPTSISDAGGTVTIYGSNFISDSKVEFNNDTYNRLSPSYISSNGTQIQFTLGGLWIANALPNYGIGAHQIRVVNSDTSKSNAVNFTIVAATSQPSITVTSPNGGERFIQGVNNTLSWQGGKNMVRLGLVEGNATNQADPAPLIIGWINEIDTARYTQNSIAWDGKQVCDLNFVSCKPVAPGNYKLIASSQDANGNFVLWDNVANKPGNWDISNAPFSIVAATTIVPTMNVSLDVSTPTSVTLNPGQAGVRFASIKVSANKDPINNMNSIQIGSDSANAAAFLANFKVYDGATLLSSSSFDMDYNGNYYYKWMRVSGVSIPAYSDKVLTVMADVKPQSPVGVVRLGIAGWNFDSPGATVAPFGTPFYGNQMTVASVVTPSITVLSPRTGAILNLGAPVVNVSWTHSGLPSSSTIEIELQKGNTVVKNYGSYNNTGNATIVIPSEMAVGDDYKINVLYRFSQNQGVVGSSGMFSIVAATTPTFRLDPIGNKTAIVGQELSFAISASGADDGAVVFQTSGRPAGAKFLPLGDTTLNGGLSSLDGSYILQYLEGSPPRVFSAAQRILADVNRDETIAKADYNLLLNIVVGNQKRKNVNVFSWTPTVAGAYPITFIATAGGNTVREIATITVVAPSSGGGGEGGGGGGAGE